jgi:hypothetical protein
VATITLVNAAMYNPPPIGHKYVYRAFFVCVDLGPDTENTIIAIHNPSYQSGVAGITVQYSYVQSDIHGDINAAPNPYGSYTARVEPNAAADTGCQSFQGALPGSFDLANFTGYMIVYSNIKLDVTALYRTQAADGTILSLSTQYIPSGTWAK